MDTVWLLVQDGLVVNSVIIPEEATWNDAGVEDETVGASYCAQFGEGLWIRTYEDESRRKWFAGVGFTYRADLDAFVPPKPDTDCTLDETLCHWISADGKDLSARLHPTQESGR
jgi:hypothetical protein